MNVELKDPGPFPIATLSAVYSKLRIIPGHVELSWMGRNLFLWKNSEHVVSLMKVLSVISNEEQLIARAFSDWFASAIKKAADALRGYFTFDVLQFEIGDAPWSWNEFTVLLVAHGRKLTVGERRLIQFGALFGVLHKRTEGDFGRIESKLERENCKPKIESLARWIKKQMEIVIDPPLSVFVIRDLSQAALCCSADDFEFLKSSLLFRKGLSVRPAIYYWHVAANDVEKIVI